MIVALPPLAAETIYHIKSFPITNTMINSFLALIVFIIAAIFITLGTNKYYKNNLAPKGFINFFESILEFILSYIDNVTKDRKKSLKFLPVVGGLFFFILISNWMGLLPGTGTIGIWEVIHDKIELVPILRPSNTDLNMTLAMAVFAVTLSHFVGIITIGFFKYINKFIKIADIFTAIKSLNPMKIFVAVIEFFVGFIEIFSEIAKMVSLSLRLFGNIFAGEVLLTVLAGLIAVFVPLPFMALELLVGFIQAVVFSMLTLVYLTMSTAELPQTHSNH